MSLQPDLIGPGQSCIYCGEGYGQHLAECVSLSQGKKITGIRMNELAQWMRDHPHKGFKPMPILNKLGNCIEWYWKDEQAYAESVHVDGVWIGSLLRSMETKEVVGVKIFLESTSA